jgi:hypothetical protein
VTFFFKIWADFNDSVVTNLKGRSEKDIQHPEGRWLPSKKDSEMTLPKEHHPEEAI